MSNGARTILFLHPSAELYGADRTLLQIVQGLDPVQWRAVVVVPRRGPLIPELQAAGARVEIAELGIGARGDLRPGALPRLLWSVRRGALEVRRLVKVYRPSIIHTNTMIVLGGALGARRSKVPHVWHVHEILDRPTWLAKLFARLMRGLADVVVANSVATAESFVRWQPKLQQRMRVIHNGVDASQFEPTQALRTLTRRELGIADDEQLVLCVGRINAWKGQRLLLEAATARVARAHLKARFVCAGDAPPGQEHYEDELESAIKLSALGQRFRRVPFRPDVRALYAAADVCVVPSTNPEPFGLVAIEAMAAGLPVVAADHGGLTEIVEEGVTGLRFVPGDPDELADALCRVLADSELRERMGAASRERQRELFSVERYRARWTAAYGEHARADGSALPAQAPVVHVVLGKANPDRANGVNRFVDQLARAQARAGVRAEVWGLTADPEAATPTRPYALRLFRAPGRIRPGREILDALRALQEPTVVHLHGGLIPGFARVAEVAQRAGHRVILSPHGAYRERALRYRAREKRWCLRLFDRRVLRSVHAVHALVDAEAQDMQAFVPLHKIVVVPSGQDWLEHLPRGLTERGGERPLFGYLGRLTAHTKGLDLLIDAFAAYKARGGRGRLAICGEGPDRKMLEERMSAAGLGLSARVLEPRFGEEKLAFLAELDLFVHPSRHEGLPGAVLEAAALSCPVLVTEATNLGDAVRRCDAGLVVPDENVRQLTAALESAAEEHASGRLAARGKRARALVAAEFDWRALERRFATQVYSMSNEPPAALDPLGDLVAHLEARRTA